MKRKEKTSKSFQLVGTQQYINANTGEVVDMNVIEVSERDANFQKLWLGNILQAIDEFSSQKIKIIFWLVAEASAFKNMIPKTISEIAEELKMSRTTVTDTIKILERNDILKRKTGVIFMNPDVVFKGSHSSRMDILIRYKSLKNDSIEEEEKVVTDIRPEAAAE